MPDPNLNPDALITDGVAGVLSVAQQFFGVRYSEGSDRLGPNGFDCSSYVWYCYLHGAGIDIGQDTAAQLTNSAGSLVQPSSPTLPNPSGGPPYTYADLLPGDLIFWGTSYNNLKSQHVEMFYGDNLTYGGQTYLNSSLQPVVVAEYHSGDVAHPSYLTMNPNGTIAGDGVAPVLAVLRYRQSMVTMAGVAVSSTFEGPSGSGANVTGNTNTPSTDLTADLADPRNNLPFSRYFMSQQVNFQGFTGTTPLFSERHLVRGGIGQAGGQAGGKRPGGNFMCYFMMNPSSLSVSYALDSTPVAAFSQSGASNSTPAVSTTQNSTISFQLIFNRMYEVWRGDTPGPSDIGCRWDTRALERLIGIYDNIDPSNPLGSHGAALPYPMANPVQAVFGNQNSVIFNGYITSLSYEYTLFSKDMIPIECYANISILLQWFNPGKDIVNSISNVPADYYTSTPIFAGSVIQVAGNGPLQGFLGVQS